MIHDAELFMYQEPITLHVLYSMYISGSAHEKFGLMIRFDNVLFANVLVSSDPNTKSVEFLWVGAGSTLVFR